MFKSPTVVSAYANLIGWRQDPTGEINLPATLTDTETGEYYQDKHPALNVTYIQTLLQPDYTIDDYLRNVITDATNEIFNDLLQYRQLDQYGKTLLQQSTLLNRYGWKKDLITNQNRFVGLQIRVKSMTALQLLIDEIGLQLSGVQDLTLSLFHSSKNAPIATIDITTTGQSNWIWKKTTDDFELSAFDSGNYRGGVFVLGYYQEDLTTQAVNYTNFNWSRGECSSCPGSAQYVKQWKSIQKYFQVYPLYVPQNSFTKDEMFDLNDAIYSETESFGLNLRLTVRCDLTDFFTQNKFAFKNLLKLKVVYKVMNMMKFSQEINNIEENIKMMIIRDLEGDIDTKLVNIPTQYQKELKAVSFNTSGINSSCLGCQDEGFAPDYGTV